jgi:uncharacterized protein DUF6152
MRAKTLAVLAAVVLLVSAPAWAHHSFAAEFDQNDKVDLTGTITKVEWMNPHAHFSLAVKDAGGKVTVWDFESGSPNALARRGINRNALKPGDTLHVIGYRAKDHSNLASAGTVTFSDGRSAFAGTSGDGSPGK